MYIFITVTVEQKGDKGHATKPERGIKDGMLRLCKYS